MKNGSTLLRLAREFDSIKRTAPNADQRRLAIAIKMEDLLGSRRDEYGQHYEALFNAKAKNPATGALRRMGIGGAKRRSSASIARRTRRKIVKCGRTCRLRTAGMDVKDVRLRQNSVGHRFELIRVK